MVGGVVDIDPPIVVDVPDSDTASVVVVAVVEHIEVLVVLQLVGEFQSGGRVGHQREKLVPDGRKFGLAGHQNGAG